MKRKEIINFDNLGLYIKEIENLFKGHNINQVEQDLILNQCLMRVKTQDKNRQIQDMISNVPLGGLLKRIIKTREKPEE